MGFARLLIVIAVAGFALHWWSGHRSAERLEASAARSPSGFVRAAMPDGAPTDTVFVLAPLDCPSEAAQRADRLADQLRSRHIPVVRSSQYSANASEPSAGQRADIDRAVLILNGEIPAVFLNGMAKSNPTADEVIAEFRRTRPRD